jgi:hypothetical protein
MKPDFAVLKSNENFSATFTTSSDTITLSYGDFIAETSNAPSHTYTLKPIYLLNIKDIDNSLITGITIDGNSLTAIDVSRFKNLTTIDVSNNSLNTRNVERLLNGLDNIGTTNGTLNVIGNPTLTGLSASGLISKANLEAKGWNISGIFSPLQGSPNAWFDASDGDTITEDLGVSQWDDKSGNGYDLTQIVGTSQPDYNTHQINGLSTVRFDPTTRYLETNTKFGLPSPSSDIMVFAIMQPLESGDRRWFELGSNSNGTFRPSLDMGIRYGGGYVTWDITSANTDMLGVWQQTTGARHDEAQYFHNGTERTRISPDDSKIWGNSTERARLGNALTGGVGIFDIGELIIVESVDVTLRQKIEGYLAHKWGLESNLDVSHPYKTLAP